MILYCRSLPWNQNTIFGWIGDTIFSILVSSSYLILNYGVLSFFMAIDEFHRAFPANFLKLLTSANMKSRHMKVALRDSIRFHNLCKR